ncbi:hypothetical protein [Burkholderia lata]|uniref:hypothetical protein n=1 Tax=Burkholderia lata (strain ATCC 17760 / DSM 23089 / LMG 22485 / NCIMB 9086 / R18194 / 383) TaxID=482957 RepID=UPI0020C61F88|nr:hypothetical protein [Burkholderia lata]
MRFAIGEAREFVCDRGGHVGAYARQVAVRASAEPEARRGRALGIVLVFDPAIRMQPEQRVVVDIQPVVCVRHASSQACVESGARVRWCALREECRHGAARRAHAALWGDCKPFGDRAQMQRRAACAARAGRAGAARRHARPTFVDPEGVSVSKRSRCLPVRDSRRWHPIRPRGLAA